MYFYFSLVLIVIFVINSSFYLSIKNTIYDNYNKYKQLSVLKKKLNITVSLNLIKLTIYFIIKTLWAMIVQRFLNNVEQISKHKYIATFVIGGKLYKIIVKHNSQPSPILQIYDKESNDITNSLEPFLLYKYQPITPSDLDFDDITILYSNGNDVTTCKNDVIAIQ